MDDLRNQVRLAIQGHFGLEVEIVEGPSSTDYRVLAPTGKVVVVIPVRFHRGVATQLALSHGFGGMDCPLRRSIDGKRGEHEPHPLDRPAVPMPVRFNDDRNPF